MQPLQIERQTDQTPLARGGHLAAQRELAEAQHLFDNPNHGLDRAFAQAVDHFPEHGFELGGHLNCGTGVVGWRRRQRGKALLPTRVMRIAPCGNVRVNPAALTRRNIRFAKVPIVHRSGSWRPDLRWNRIQGRFGFSLIGRVVRERHAYNQQAVLIDRQLRGIVLLEALCAAVFHDPRFGIGEVVLVLVARTGDRRFGCAPTRRPSGLPRFLGPFLHLGIIVCLLRRRSFGGPRLQHRFGFGQARQASLPDSDFIAHHQAIGQVALIDALTQDEQLLERAQKSRGYQATNGVAVPTVRTGRKFGYQ